MKKIVCMLLAALFAAVPLAACSPAAGEEDTLPPAAESPEVPAPETPELPSEPSVPVAPDPEPVPEPDPEPEVLMAQYVYVLRDGLNVRSGAGTQYSAVGQADKDELYHYIRRTGDWYETYYQNKKAYLSANGTYTTIASLESAEDAVEDVIEEGLRLLGVPYVYGAVRLHDGKGNFLTNFTIRQFDCSSLMQYIFYQGAGILLNTTTRTQVTQGREVKDALRRGDLMFFTNAQRYYKTGIERVGHVALYLGKNYILHTASDYAKIEQISAQRWKYYLSARRFF